MLSTLWPIRTIRAAVSLRGGCAPPGSCLCSDRWGQEPADSGTGHPAGQQHGLMQGRQQLPASQHRRSTPCASGGEAHQRRASLSKLVCSQFPRLLSQTPATRDPCPLQAAAPEALQRLQRAGQAGRRAIQAGVCALCRLLTADDAPVGFRDGLASLWLPGVDEKMGHACRHSDTSTRRTCTGHKGARRSGEAPPCVAGGGDGKSPRDTSHMQAGVWGAHPGQSWRGRG